MFLKQLTPREYVLQYVLQRFIRKAEVTATLVRVDGVSIEIPVLPVSLPLPRKVLGISVDIRRNNGSVSLKKISSNKYRLSFDLAGEIADYLTLSFEKGCEKDSYGRVNWRHLRKKIEFPEVDLLVYLFKELLAEQGLDLEYKKFEDKNFAIAVTHDIDRTGDDFVYRGFTHLYSAVKRHSARPLKTFFAAENKDFQVKHVLEIEDKYGVSDSTWFFLPRRGLPKNADYSMDSKFCRMALQLLFERDKGWHISNIPLQKRHLEKELMHLKKYFAFDGARAHWLRGDYDELLPLLEQLGIRYDSTFGIRDHWSFRFGTSYPFRFIEPKAVHEIYELPLNVMDMNVNNLVEFGNYLDRLFPILHATHSTWVVNWHPNRFNEDKYGSLSREAFELVLSKGKKYGALMSSLQEVGRLAGVA